MSICPVSADSAHPALVIKVDTESMAFFNPAVDAVKVGRTALYVVMITLRAR
jgi:hypothetical protein